jgi:hypothetical protein
MRWNDISPGAQAGLTRGQAGGHFLAVGREIRVLKRIEGNDLREVFELQQ